METYRRDDLVFDVTDAGDSGAEAVVLLHGFPQDRTAWTGVSRPLNDAGFRTLAPDQRGYSPGARPRHRGDYSLRECALDVIALLDAAGLTSAHIVGHDWGGGAAWELASSFPDRLRSVTVLSTPHPGAMAWSMTHSNQALRSWYMALFQVPWLPERVLRRTLSKQLRSTGLPAEYAGRYAQRFERAEDLTGPLGWYRALPASLIGSGGPGRIKVPTTYVWGKRDFALGAAAAHRTAHYVDATYRFVELDAGHWLPETRPEPVAEAILSQVRDPESAG